MTRRNRQKLHRELRLAAEARKARMAGVRRQRRLDAVATDAAVRRALAGERARASGAAHLNAMRQLMALAGVRGSTQGRVVRLVEVVADRVPGLAVAPRLPVFLLLARRPWQRPPEAWAPPSGSILRKLRSLVGHLLVRYSAPEFLVRSLEHVPASAVARVPTEDEWAVIALAHLGAGKSLRTLVGTPALPTPLTRRMVRVFVESPARVECIFALRRAQVVALGGRQKLARDLCASRLGTLRGPHPELGEAFWQQVIHWLCAQGVDSEHLDGVLAWAEADRRRALDAGRWEEVPWRRPVASVVDEVRREAAARARSAWRRRQVLPESGLPGGPVPGHPGWEAVELRTRPDLAEEGRTMRHCAAHYASLVSRRRASLWSLRRAGGPRVTVEVSLGSGALVQAKRKANRELRSEELAVVRAWAAHCGLAVRV